MLQRLNVGGRRALAFMVACMATACADRVGDVYLFDCLGTIGLIDGGDLTLRRTVHVAAIDSTLPGRVRDGCAIQRGWFDTDVQRLFLTVQLDPSMGANDDLRTESIALTVPDLQLDGRARPSAVRSEVGSVQDMLTKIPLSELPLGFSAVYYMNAESAILLQELTARDPGGRALGAIEMLEPGLIGLRRTITGSTGRYALYDLDNNVQRGALLSIGGNSGDDRVICFTPSGLLLLATTRDSLLIAATQGERRSASYELSEMDLHWTACAWQ